MLSSTADLVVMFIFLETAWVLSEQQKTAVHQKWILAYKSDTKELFMSNKLIYDAKFDADSEFDVKTYVTIHNQEINCKNEVLYFARFCKFLAAQEADENEK